MNKIFMRKTIVLTLLLMGFSPIVHAQSEKKPQASAQKKKVTDAKTFAEALEMVNLPAITAEMVRLWMLTYSNYSHMELIDAEGIGNGSLALHTIINGALSEVTENDLLELEKNNLRAHLIKQAIEQKIKNNHYIIFDPQTKCKVVIDSKENTIRLDCTTCVSQEQYKQCIAVMEKFCPNFPSRFFGSKPK